MLPIGEITQTAGTATITHQDGAKVVASIGTAIYQGDIVETSGDGALGIRFSDSTVIAVSEEARLVIDEYIYNPDGDGDRSFFSMMRGVFVYTSGLIGKEDPADVAITTPVGSIGIRGTVVAGDIHPAGQESSITIVDGAAVLTNAAGVFEMNRNFSTFVFSGYDSPGQYAEQKGAEWFQKRYGAIAPALHENTFSIPDDENIAPPTDHRQDGTSYVPSGDSPEKNYSDGGADKNYLQMAGGYDAIYDFFGIDLADAYYYVDPATGEIYYADSYYAADAYYYGDEVLYEAGIVDGDVYYTYGSDGLYYYYPDYYYYGGGYVPPEPQLLGFAWNNQQAILNPATDRIYEFIAEGTVIGHIEFEDFDGYITDIEVLPHTLTYRAPTVDGVYDLGSTIVQSVTNPFTFVFTNYGGGDIVLQDIPANRFLMNYISHDSTDPIIFTVRAWDDVGYYTDIEFSLVMENEVDYYANPGQRFVGIGANGETFAGSAADDIFATFEGDDIIDTNGGHDIVLAGDGSDTIFIDDTLFDLLDGGNRIGDFDEIVFQAPLTLDFSTTSDLAFRMSGIEKISMNSAGSSLTLSFNDIFAITDSFTAPVLDIGGPAGGPAALNLLTADGWTVAAGSPGGIDGGGLVNLESTAGGVTITLVIDQGAVGVNGVNVNLV